MAETSSDRSPARLHDARAAGVSRRAFLEAGASGAVALAAVGTVPLADAAAARLAPRDASPISVWQSAGGDRHASRPALAWQPYTTSAAEDIEILPARRKQEVLGFGGAFTDAATYMFSRLAPEARAALFHELFDPPR